MKPVLNRCSVYIAFVVLILLASCGKAGCSRDESHAIGDVREDRQNPDKILATPVRFEAQSVEESLRMLQSGRQLTNAEIAQCIVVGESALYHLSQTLEELRRNEDAADAWNICNELARRPWLRQSEDIVEALGKQQLDAAEAARYEGMVKSIDYNHKLIAELKKQYPRLPDFLPDKVSSEQ